MYELLKEAHYEFIRLSFREALVFDRCLNLISDGVRTPAGLMSMVLEEYQGRVPYADLDADEWPEFVEKSAQLALATMEILDILVRREQPSASQVQSKLLLLENLWKERPYPGRLEWNHKIRIEVFADFSFLIGCRSAESMANDSRKAPEDGDKGCPHPSLALLSIPRYDLERLAEVLREHSLKQDRSEVHNPMSVKDLGVLASVHATCFPIVQLAQQHDREIGEADTLPALGLICFMDGPFRFLKRLLGVDSSIDYSSAMQALPKNVQDIARSCIQMTQAIETIISLSVTYEYDTLRESLSIMQDAASVLHPVSYVYEMALVDRGQ